MAERAAIDPDHRYAIFIVRLPYSRQEFGVPSNLHIIGTMNTADRSAEALDTALRRRFEFRECVPRQALLSQDQYAIDEVDIEALLATINSRIERLRATFANRLIPLLQEYFYDDWSRIGPVLGKQFVKAE